MVRKLTHQEYVERLRSCNPTIAVIDEYVASNVPIGHECKICGHQFQARPSNTMGSKNKKPSGCPKCSGNLKKSHQEFLEEMSIVHPTIRIVSGVYETNKSEFELRCLDCGHAWRQRADVLSRGHGCQKCAVAERGRKQRKPKDVFAEQLAAVNPTIDPIGDYVGANKPMLVRCRECFCEWEARPANLLKGTGCDSCSSSHTSFIEQFILGSFRLALAGREVCSREKDAIGMELDIYIPELRFAVEPGSWYWHKDKIEKDEEKRAACRERGIRLVTVYEGFVGDAKPFAEDCIIHEGLFKNDASARMELIRDLFLMAGVDRCLSDAELRALTREARMNATMTPLKFKQRVESRNEYSEVIGLYNSFLEPVQMRCKYPGCKKEWLGNPKDLLAGRGCPYCRYDRAADSNRNSHEQFMAEFVKTGPADVEVIGLYAGRHKPVESQCLVCGFKWFPQAGNLLAGHGCPNCARRRNLSRKRTQQGTWV